MKQYIVFLPNGNITRTGVCVDADLPLQARPGEQVLEGVADCAEHYILGGAVFNIPSQPSPHHNFDYTTKQWVDPRTLADLKATKTAEINAARLTANRSSFTFAGKQIACDELSRSDIDGFNGIVSLTGALPPNWIGYWKAVDNTLVPIPDVATWTGLYAAMVAQGQTNFAHSQDLKTALAAAATAVEVEGIVW